MNKPKVYIALRLRRKKSLCEIRVASEDGSPLDPQTILDAISDYLLVYENLAIEEPDTDEMT